MQILFTAALSWIFLFLQVCFAFNGRIEDVPEICIVHYGYCRKDPCDGKSWLLGRCGDTFFCCTIFGSDCEDTITCSRAFPGLIIDSFLLKQVFSILHGSFPGNISNFPSWDDVYHARQKQIYSAKYPGGSSVIGQQLIIKDISGITSEISGATTRMQLKGYNLNAVFGTQYNQVNGDTTIKPNKYAGRYSAAGGQLIIGSAQEITSEISRKATGIKPSVGQWDVSPGKHQIIGASISQTSQYPEKSSEIGGRLFKRSSRKNVGSFTKLNIETHPFVTSIVENPKIGANLINSFLPVGTQPNGESNIIIQYPKYCLGKKNQLIGRNKNKASLCKILRLLSKPTKVNGKWMINLV